MLLKGLIIEKRLKTIFKVVHLCQIRKLMVLVQLRDK